MSNYVNTLENLKDIEEKEYYAKAFMTELHGNMPLYALCKKANLPLHNGRTITWRLFKDIHYPKFKEGDKAPDGTTIASGSPLIGKFKELGEIPEDTPNKLTLVEFSASIKKVGDRLQITEDVNLKGIDNILDESFTAMGREAGQLFEDLVALGMVSGKNKYVSTATTSNTDAIIKEIKKIKAFLQKKHVPKFAGAKYVAICDSDFELTLGTMKETNNSWMDIAKYSNPKEVYDGEIGSFLGFRWIVNDDIPKTADGKSQVIFMGDDAIGVVNLTGQSNAPKLIYNKPGSMGNDHYHEIHEIAWINRGFTTRILRDEAIVRYEVATEEATITNAITSDSERSHYKQSKDGQVLGD